MNTNARKFITQHVMEILLLIMIVVISIVKPSFLSVNNILGILRNMALVGVISFGMSMVIIGGEIDLSVGSGIALYGVILAMITKQFSSAGLSSTLGVIVGLIVVPVIAALVGMFNGYIRTKFKLPSFIITLAMQMVLYGFAGIFSGGFPITSFPQWFNVIGSGRIFGIIPLPVIWLLIIFAITHVIMNYTRFGREVYAVGGNQESARLSGINVDRVKIIIMAIVQVLTSFTAVILSSQVMSASSTFGKGYDMDVIASVIIGGASLNGGIGKIWGTLIGILFQGVITNAMTLLGFDDFLKYVVRGLIILFAVLINTVQVNRSHSAD